MKWAFFAAASLALSVSVGSATADAQVLNPADVAARRALIQRAQEASDRRDHVQALDLANRAGQIQMTPSLRLFIAQEHEALGQYAAALGSAELCTREVDRDPSAANRAEIQSECRTMLQQLQPRVGFITVEVPSAPQGLQVRVNGSLLNSALVGTPYTVDPGSAMVDLRAPSHRAVQQSVTVRAGANTNVRVQMVYDPSAPSVLPTGDQVLGPVRGPRRFTAVHGALIGGGGALAVGGIVFGVLTLSLASQFNATDSANERLSLQGRGDAFGWVSNVGIGAGVITAAVGLILYLVQDTTVRPQ